MLSFILSTHAYLRRLLLALLILPCLVVAEQAQQTLYVTVSGEPGMSITEHYTLGGDSLRLRHSREFDSVAGGSFPDHSVIPAYESTLVVPAQTTLQQSSVIFRCEIGFFATALARAPPALSFIVA